MNTLEDGKIYRLDHNGVISFAFIESRPEVNETIVYDSNRAWDVAGYAAEDTENGLRYKKGDSYFEFSPLTLETAPEVFTNTIRTFNDLAVLEQFARKDIYMAESYTPNTEPDETVSFTISDEEEVLALIKVTREGDMFYWANDNWTEVGPDDDLPEVYDQEVIDVEQTDIGAALDLWKNAVATGQTLTKEDILSYAALDQ